MSRPSGETALAMVGADFPRTVKGCSRQGGTFIGYEWTGEMKGHSPPFSLRRLDGEVVQRTYGRSKGSQ